MPTVLRHNGKRSTFFPRSERVNPSFFILYKFFPSQFFSYFFSTFTLTFPFLFHFSHSLIFLLFPHFCPTHNHSVFFSLSPFSSDPISLFLYLSVSLSFPFSVSLFFLCPSLHGIYLQEAGGWLYNSSHPDIEFQPGFNLSFHIFAILELSSGNAIYREIE